MERTASQNINNDDTKVECEIKLLNGLPDDLIARLEKVKDKESTHAYVSLKYPEIFPALRLVKHPETRRRLMYAKET